MSKREKETTKGLKILLIITFAFLALFIAFFLIFNGVAHQANDPALKDFGASFKYHVDGFKGLFSFKFHDASNIIYFALSCLLYSGIALWIIFLVVGILVGKKYKTAIVTFGIVLTFLAIVSYLFVASGTPKYWLIINRRAPFEKTPAILAMTFALLAFGALFALFSFVSYFACIVEAFKNARTESKKEEAEEAPATEETEKEETTKEEEPVVFEAFETEPEPEFDAPILEEPEEEPEHHEKESSLSKDELADLIRGIVREEMSQHVPPQGPFGPGPLVVQYFGTVPGQAQTEQAKPVEPAPAKEEPTIEPAPVEETVEPVKEEPVSEPVKEELAPTEPAEKNKIIRIPFQERMLNADDEMKKNYNELKNEILSYGVNSRVSNSGDAFRLHRKTYVKITIAGLSLKLYFALDPKDYKDSPLPIQDAGHKGIYAEIPLVFKVKSGLSMRRAKELIQTVMEKDGFEQGPIADTDWVEKLKDEPTESEED